MSAIAGAAEPAPAKVNLALHVVGRRADGYHELDTLVVFTRFGDLLEAISPLSCPSRLAIGGPFAAGLSEESDNLVLRALGAFEAAITPLPSLALKLTKRLPIASGIGGGSADAAAVLRLAARLAGLPTDSPRLLEIAGRIGADVPMCLLSQPLRARGIGERIEAWPGPPSLPILLVNPGAEVPTPAVFRGLERRENAPLPGLPAATPAALADWLTRSTRNDLQRAAIREAPVIAEALQLVASTTGCRLARMSGSGATVFGLYASDAEAALAAATLTAARPGWWIVATRTGGS